MVLGAAPMSSKHLKVLESIFREPASGNIHWREVESLFHHLGATIEPAHGARIRVVLNRAEGFFHRPHHGGACSKHDVRHLREFLAHAGATPSALEPK